MSFNSKIIKPYNFIVRRHFKVVKKEFAIFSKCKSKANCLFGVYQKCAARIARNRFCSLNATGTFYSGGGGG